MKSHTGVVDTARQLFTILNTPRSLTCLLLVRYGEWAQLSNLAVSPRNYLEGPWGAAAFAKDSQATDFLRKSPLLTGDDGRKEAAEATFDLCERQCLETNEFLRLLDYPSASESPAESAYRTILVRARKIARKILGPIPDEIEPSFGPGTSFEMMGRTYTTLADKVTETPTATPACSDVFEHYFWPSSWGRERLGLGLPLPGTSPGNRFTTVPKDSKTDRGICIEPLGNIWIQLGIGRYLKRRLRRVGLNVDRLPTLDPIQHVQAALVGRPKDGQHLHRELARLGSLTGEWATIDLSNASDTVSYELVRRVIPADWFSLLCSCRSPKTLFKGQWHHLQKFSSMGNGTTFELETLVFAALIAATTGLEVGREFWVYGDDIIVPTSSYRDALAVLKMSGFTPNPRKSFGSGPFRESCGGDFFSGYPVRSYFAKGRFESPLEWIAMHNSLYARFGHRGQRVLERIVRQVPIPLRLFGPSFLADRVFHGCSRREKRFRHKGGWQCVNTVVPQPLKVPLDRWGSLHLTMALLGCPSQGITPRDSIRGWTLKPSSVS